MKSHFYYRTIQLALDQVSMSNAPVFGWQLTRQRKARGRGHQRMAEIGVPIYRPIEHDQRHHARTSQAGKDVDFSGKHP
jgi:hypothetical protein